MQLRRTLSLTVVAALAFLIMACAPDYGVAVRNLTAQELAEASVNFDGFSSIGGVLPSGIYKITYDVGRPIPDRATVRWRSPDGALQTRIVKVRDVVPRNYGGRIFFEIMPDGNVRVVARDNLPSLTTNPD